MDEAFSDKGLDAFNRPRLGGIGEVLAPEIERITGIETRATVLGHIQRGGSPSGFDRVLATRLGLHAADAVVDGRVGPDGVAQAAPTSSGCRSPRRSASSTPCRSTATKRPPRSSADRMPQPQHPL